MNKRVIIFLGAIIIAGLSLWLIQSPVKNSAVNESLDEIIQKRSLWEEEIRKSGASRFWQETTFEYEANYNRHTVAHIYGELLYKIYGLDGLQYCDEKFSYGCYHSFFANALAEAGTEIISDLDAVCVNKFGSVDSGCQHGIGHGILQYLGEARLNEALLLCEPMISRGESCLAGVFMEYNFPTEVAGLAGMETVRAFDENKPYYPCEDVAKKFKGSCYYELPRFWDRVLASDFSKIGQLCEAVPEKDGAKEKCFKGTGDVVSLITNHNVEDTIARCAEMPTKSAEETCRVAAAWGFYASIDEHKRNASKVCEGLREELMAQCP